MNPANDRPRNRTADNYILGAVCRGDLCGPKEDEMTKDMEHLRAFADGVFGDVADMDEAEVDELYAAIAPGIDPAQRIYESAAKAAQPYRLRGENVPPHVQAALDATENMEKWNGVYKMNQQYTCPVLMRLQGWLLRQPMIQVDKNRWVLMRGQNSSAGCMWPAWMTTLEYRFWNFTTLGRWLRRRSFR